MRIGVVIVALCIWLFGWEMNGASGDIKIEQSSNIIWWYSDRWHECCYDTPYLSHLIEGGSGYWSYNGTKFHSFTQKINYHWHEGWNFVTPVFKKWNLEHHFKDHAPFIWRYENGHWKLFSKQPHSFPSFSSLEIGEGAWVYLPSIDILMDKIPLFCKDGQCTKIINTSFNYTISIKTNPIKDLRFAFDLYRYSNQTHYKLAIGPINITHLDETIPICVAKAGSEKCRTFNNKTESILTYNKKYLIIDAVKIAKLFDKTIPSSKERFQMTFYIQGIKPKGFIKKAFGTLGIEGFGTWVSLKDSYMASFEMELR